MQQEHAFDLLRVETIDLVAVQQLSGTIAAGAYCVMVYDAGNQSGPINYTVVVQHY